LLSATVVIDPATSYALAYASSDETASMKLTSLAFLETVEGRVRKVLPPTPHSGAEWRFQRFLAFHNQSGSLQVFVQGKGRESQLLSVLHVREVRDETGAFLRGWIQTETMPHPEPFVLHMDAVSSIETNIQAIADGWAEELMQVLSPMSSAIEQQPAGEKPPNLRSGGGPVSP
jgi:hypothetical protein